MPTRSAGKRSQIPPPTNHASRDLHVDRVGECLAEEEPLRRPHLALVEPQAAA